MQWLKRVGYGLVRRFRIIQGFFRFYGGKARQQWQALGHGRRGRLARLAVLGTAVVLVWSLWVVAGAVPRLLTARRSASPPLPIASGVGDEVHARFDSGHDSSVTRPAATSGETAGSSTGVTGAGVHPPVPGGSPSDADQRTAVASSELQTPTAPTVSEHDRPAARLTELAYPALGTIGDTSGWRRHVAHGYWYYEPGVELVTDPYTRVQAVLPGRVTYVGSSSPGNGLAVVIDHGDGLRSEYKSLTDVYVVRGQFVSARAPIGRTDSTLVFAVFQDDELLDTQALLAGN